MREATLNVLSPEFVHGFALALLAKRDQTTPLRIFWPLGVNLETMCQHLAPMGVAYVLSLIHI
eukprot:3368854-Alexandrium_andersonii.AAC.1